MEVQFWLNLQTHYDMEVAQEALQTGLIQKSIHFRMRHERGKGTEKKLCASAPLRSIC